MPLIAKAETILKNPLSYSLREYGVVLGIALLGGLASWYAKVQRGELQVLSIASLIGELAISAFVGLLAFWLCEYLNFAPLLTAAIVGMSGHAGAKAISRLEAFGLQLAEKKLGIENKKDAS
ncbi:MAG: phage holin family protein [Pseudomonadota bacterium]